MRKDDGDLGERQLGDGIEEARQATGAEDAAQDEALLVDAPRIDAAMTEQAVAEDEGDDAAGEHEHLDGQALAGRLHEHAHDAEAERRDDETRHAAAGIVIGHDGRVGSRWSTMNAWRS